MNIDIAQYAGTFLFYPVVLVLGISGGLVSCALLEVPFITAVITTTRNARREAFYKTLAFLAGLIVSYVIIGLFISQINKFFSNHLLSTKWLFLLLGAIAVLWGYWMIWREPDIDRCSDHGCDGHSHGHEHSHEHTPEHPHEHAHPGHSHFEFILKWIRPTSLLNVFLIGNLFAWIETPLCPGCGPVIYLLAMLTLLKGQMISGVITFMLYAIGQGIPVLIIVMGFSHWFDSPFIVKNKAHVQLLMFNILIVTGGALIWLS